ncbi:MAG TPA: hypothetical protein VK651_01005, partial [Blastocatellia bacterium]|nr:hypothetical protein [Blastocatellia bacterium]
SGGEFFGVELWVLPRATRPPPATPEPFCCEYARSVVHGRRQKAESRRQRQKAEGRKQKAEGRRQKAVV